MCGIAGIVGRSARDPGAPAVLAEMLRRLAHRGPDDEHVVDGGHCLLGARRLSILDLEGGRQPVANERGDVVVALNGEIYGHEALRRDLAARGHRFRTRSDTEVVLRLYEEEGELCLERLEGMFALAVWDARRRTLLLARDRLGEKPLFWFRRSDDLVFASEVQALEAHPDAPRDLDDEALALYLLHRFVPAPRSGLQGVERLAPGHVLRWRDGLVSVRPYWSLPTPPARTPLSCRAPVGADVERVRALFTEAVASRLEADVPVGVFLSGGIDSGAIAAAAMAFRRPLPTFTLRPADPAFDEGAGARETAQRLGTEHHEVVAGEDDLKRGYEEVFERVHEPIGDSSLVPTLLLAKAARQRVKVVLSGEGADELFGGYPTYLGARVAPLVRPVPRGLLLALSRHVLDAGRLGNVGTGWLLRRLVEGAHLPALERHLLWFGAFSPAEQALLWRPEARPPIVGAHLLDAAREAVAPVARHGDPVDALLRADLLTHLPEALLAKVDRATMAAGLEARAPFLERRLVEAVAAMPSRWKVRGLSTKVLLKRVLTGLLPRATLMRKKRGFAVPVSKTFQGWLGARLEERLATAALFRERLDPGYARALLDEHRRGAADHGRKLYTLLALVEWSERRGSSSPKTPAKASAKPATTA